MKIPDTKFVEIVITSSVLVLNSLGGGGGGGGGTVHLGLKKINFDLVTCCAFIF